MKPAITFTSSLHENRLRAVWAGRWAADAASVFLPEGFEKNYSYPVIVCLSEAGPGFRGHQPFHQLLDSISDRNYVGIHIVIEQAGQQPVDLIQQQVEAAVRQVSRYANLHSERIYLLGQGKMAELALQLTLAAPLQYAGFLAVEPPALDKQGALTHFRKLRHLRGLILTSTESASADLRQTARLLHNAGLEIHFLRLNESHPLTSSQLINRFIMQNILGSQLCCR